MTVKINQLEVEEEKMQASREMAQIVAKALNEKERDKQCTSGT